MRQGRLSHVSERAEAGAVADLPLYEVADAFPFGFVITDRDGLVRDSNPAATRLFGLEDGALVDASLVALVPPRYRRTVRSALAGVEQGRTAFTWEQEVQLPDGQLRAVEVSAFGLDTARQGLVAWVFHDIRDRVAVERRLRVLTGDLEERVLERTRELEMERARLTAAVRQIPAGLVIVDAPDGNVVTANEEALRTLRVRELDDVGEWQGWRMDGTPYAADEWPLVRSLVTGEVVTGERAELLVGDGSRIVLEISSAPVHDHSGHAIGAVCVFTDATARERRERVERDFVTNAAHELQTPLAALVSAVEVLMSGAKDRPERDLFLNHVSRESERLTRLVRGLLVLARAELGAELPVTGIVPIAPMLEAVAAQLTPAPAVAVTTSCPNDLAALSNAELLRHALENVAENAAKYTREGTIRISARRTDDGVEISVADTGPGVPEAEQARVFERFYRGAAGTGSGLGLAITRAVMETLGGDVELDSTVGSGTVIRLRVPHAAMVKS